MTHPFGFDYDVAIAPDEDYWQLLARGNQESIHLDSRGLTPSGCLKPNPAGQTAIGGFEDIVYPYLHATRPVENPVDNPTFGWCSPDFKCRCIANADCPDGGVCQGAVGGLGFDTRLPGTLGMEIDHDLIPESYLPRDGDRVAVFGRWIVDCGHGDNDQGVSGFHTEIHPPLLVASGRQTDDGFFRGALFGGADLHERDRPSVLRRPGLPRRVLCEAHVARGGEVGMRGRDWSAREQRGRHLPCRAPGLLQWHGQNLRL
jgi:hypothetical protein